MRWILIVAATIVLAGWIGWKYETTNRPVAANAWSPQWRRTVDGWERISVRSNTISIVTNRLAPANMDGPWKVHPHPIVMSLMISLLSAFGLVAADSRPATLQTQQVTL